METPSVPDLSFEQRLHKMFAEAPPAPDAHLFARRLEERLDRAWAARRMAISLAGGGSALIAVWQMAGLSVAARVEEALRSPFALAWRRAGLLAADTPLLRLAPFSNEILWLLGGLVLLAAGLLVTRAVDEL